jgi:DNA-binding MarR family transcriptional regulator
MRRVTNDHLKSLGYLALGSRLKRLGERLQAQTQSILAESGFTVPASHYPLLATLNANGPMNVSDLACGLDLAQPGVTRMLASLQQDGIVTSKADPLDRRVRIISLTAEGSRVVARARNSAFPRIERAVADACASLEGPLLAQIDALEEQLQTAPLSARTGQMKRRANA